MSEGTTREGLERSIAEEAASLGVPGAGPTGYGLGKSGWVDIPFRDANLSLGVLTDWVEESYRLVAPKKLIAQLDERRR